MKTISMKTNPAFKRAQPLPMLPSAPMPRTVATAMNLPEFTPPAGELRRQMASLAVCAMTAHHGFNAPAMRLTN